MLAVAALLALAGCATTPPQPDPLSWGQVHTFSDGTTVRVNPPTVWGERHCVDYNFASHSCRDTQPHRTVKVAVVVVNPDEPTMGGRMAAVTVDGHRAPDLYPGHPGHVDLRHLDGPAPRARWACSRRSTSRRRGRST